MLTCGGSGAAPRAELDVCREIEGVLHKHSGGQGAKAWLTDPAEDNPLFLDWPGIRDSVGPVPPSVRFAARASLIAAPDR